MPMWKTSVYEFQKFMTDIGGNIGAEWRIKPNNVTRYLLLDILALHCNLHRLKLFGNGQPPSETFLPNCLYYTTFY